MGVGEFVDEYRTAAVEFVTGFIDHLISSEDEWRRRATYNGGCVFAFYFVLSRTVWNSVRLVIVGGLFTIQLLRLDNNAIFFECHHRSEGMQTDNECKFM